MSAADLTNPVFTDETAAREWLEQHRWPDGVTCPHCGGVEKITKLQGQAHRPGLFECYNCNKQFSVTVGTLYERSHIPLHKWLLATHLLTSSKKGMSAHQMHRMLGITYKSAWFMCHRIREGLVDTNPDPIGGEGKTVEADETFLGTQGYEFGPDGWNKKRGRAPMKTAFTLVERGGKARSFQVDSVKSAELRPLLMKAASRKSVLNTDEGSQYTKMGREFAKHETVNHSAGEYGRGKAHTNTVEGFFSIFKRGMQGTYQHCGEQHLHRYLAEFDFRYNNRVALEVTDAMRHELAIKGIEGKRLTYRRTRVGA